MILEESLKKISRLKQVSLAMDIYRDNNELEVVLGKLPETHFSRLSSSDSVSFDFKVENSFEGDINL